MANKKKQTGTGKIKFEYFTEMDDILGKKPNVAPLATYDSESSQPTYRGLSTYNMYFYILHFISFLFFIKNNGSNDVLKHTQLNKISHL